MAHPKSTPELVLGRTTKSSVFTESLVEAVKQLRLTGATLYVGYPVLSTTDGRLSYDAILTSLEHGIVIFDFQSQRPVSDQVWENLDEQQLELSIQLKSKLIRHKDLTIRRDLAVPIHVVTFVPEKTDWSPPREIFVIADKMTLGKTLMDLAGVTEPIIRPLNAAIQQVSTIKPRKKRSNVTRSDSRCAILKLIEKEIANLDQFQKQAAIECPDGPQRIRGLAGSGKTIVLALKAAYLHTQYPDWKICVTFQTQSLYGQIRDLIRRFTFDTIQDEPDWSKLKVMHAWGGRSSPGVYSTIAKRNGLTSHTFGYGKDRYGASGAFEGVCKEVLQDWQNRKQRPPELFDAVLIDEAQDFRGNFFRLIYHSTTSPKRIVWASDDLQSLSATTVPSLKKLFGVNSAGDAEVVLTNTPGKPKEDIILPKCYRNTRWCLALAHGLGFGIYRDEGKIQCFDAPSFWTDIGYGVVDGTLKDGCDVTLKRRADATPEFFAKNISPEDAVQLHRFDDEAAEYDWVAKQIQNNITVDELEPSDILVVLANTRYVEKNAGPLRARLAELNVTSHIAGITSSADDFFIEDSVTISSIYRAKGNEAAMVYIVGAQHGFGNWGTAIRSRSILFTAMTRSRAWVRLTGYGELMEKLEEEWKRIVANEYRLQFKVPTDTEREKLRQINRERSEEEQQRIDEQAKNFSEVLALISSGELSPEDFPLELRKKIADAFKGGNQ